MVTDRDDGMLLAAVIVVAGLIVGLVAWAGVRDRAGLELEVRSAHPPLTLPTTSVTTLVSDDAWLGWRHDLFWQALAAEPEPEVEVSSVAVEREPSGEVVVTNPPEAPVAPGELADLVCSFSWDCQTAKRVIACESTWNPQAVGRAGERGLAQVHPIHRQRIEAMGFTWDDMFDPVSNLTVAHALWSEQGWRPWSCA